MQRLLTAICLIFSVTAVSRLSAQTASDPAYQKTINERAAKIVTPLGIDDASKAAKVQEAIATQYLRLNTIQEAREKAVTAARDKYSQDKATLDAELLSIENGVTADVQKLHGEYLSQLSALLTPTQIDKVKDGMTYGVVPVTYKGYVDMIPTLKENEKAQILVWLIEAREHAMDGFTSEKKHAWFGKYKGRINNYLSAQGYDSKKEREEWMKRIKAAEDSKGK